MALLVGLYLLLVGVVLAVYVAAALAAPPIVPAVCMAGGRNCHKAEVAAAMRR